MPILRSAICFLCLVSGYLGAVAAECPGNPDALGTSRVIYVDPSAYPRVGTDQFRGTLPLRDHEVVLTFDDGPKPPYTGRVLDVLAFQCVKANFFIVGGMARANPELVRRAAAEGHTIGTHTEHHPFNIPNLSVARAWKEIGDGIASTKAALGDDRLVAPFFRFPGLLMAAPIEDFVNAQGLTIWSDDVDADDWTRITPDQVLARGLRRLEKAGRGIILLHDVQPRTALALPEFLKELKNRGYSVVQVKPLVKEQPGEQTVSATQVLMQR